MCLAVPARVVEKLADNTARCRIGESATFVVVSTLLLGEEPGIGDYLIVHAGFALRKLDAEDAADTLRLMREMAEAEAEDPLFSQTAEN
jgi:hydrogenase expression/formation protein HypC